MENEIIKAGPFDLAPYSADILLIVVFPDSRSKNLPLALEIARGAREYREGELDGATLHLAGFGRDPDQVARARALLRVVGAWRGAQVFGGSRRLASPWNADELLQCYQVAAGLADHRAHCHIGEHPCRLLQAHTQPFFVGGLSPAEQLAAAAVPVATDPERCPPEPWVAALLQPGAAFAGREAMMVFGDFERCLGWAFIERGAP